MDMCFQFNGGEGRIGEVQNRVECRRKKESLSRNFKVGEDGRWAGGRQNRPNRSSLEIKVLGASTRP